MEAQKIELHRVVSTAIIYKDGKYLIVKRSLEKRVYPGKWTVPGGGLEVSDYENTPKTTNDAWYYALENSLKREISEEAGVEVNKPKYLLDMAFIRPDKVPVVTLSWYCEYKSGEVKLNSENIDYKWIAAGEAKDYELIPGIGEEIQMVDKILKGEKDVKFDFSHN